MIQCMNCGEGYELSENVPAYCDGCGSDDWGEQCPTCREFRDGIEYIAEYDEECNDCRCSANKRQELGIVGTDDIVIETIVDRVRRRNLVLEDSVPISDIALREGKLTGRIQDEWCEPVVWHGGYWQVLD